MITRYVHRDYGKSPMPAVTAVVVATTPTHWFLHVHAKGVRCDTWRMPAIVGPELLDQLLPPADRIEDVL